MKRQIIRTTALICAVGFMVLVSAGCGGGGGSSEARPAVGSIKFTFKIPAKAARVSARAADKIPAGTSSMEITYMNDSLTAPVSQTVSGLQEVNTVTVDNIPVGETVFKIFAYDANGSLLAATYETAWIEDGVITTLYAELGMIFNGQALMPSSMALDAGETLNIKVASEVGLYPLSISGTNCPTASMQFGPSGQLACTFKTAGTYNVTLAGQTVGTVAVSQGSATSVLGANANAAIGFGPAPMVVQFAAGAVSSTTGAAFTYAWDFGDGTTSTQQNPAHTYGAIGSYPAVLTVTDNSGNTATDRVNIHVTILPPPSVLAVSPATGDNGTDTSIIIMGDEFQQGAAVLIGGTPAVNVAVISETEISASVPAGLAAGAYDITVTNPDDQYGVLPGAFTVTGTSAATYNATDYFPLNSGDTRTYIYDYINDDISANALETESVLGTEIVNGVTCTQLGTSAAAYECFTNDAQGLRMHKKVADSGSTVIVFSTPIKIIDAVFNVGDSFTDTQTAAVTTSGLTTTATISISADVVSAGVAYSPAGSFADTITLSLSRTTPDGVDDEISTFANGIGIINSIQSNGTDCSVYECGRMLKTANVGGTSYPTAITPNVDGQYWMAELSVDTSTNDVLTGAYTLNISGTSATISGQYGTFVSGGPLPQTASLTITSYNNGIFTNSLSTASTGLMGASGVGATIQMGNSTGMKIFFKKGSSYTSSMLDGNYWGAAYSISSGSPNVVSASFFEASLSSGNMTMTGYRSDSSGTFLSPISQSDTYTFNTGNGTFAMTSQGTDYAGMVGENGNMLMSVKTAAGTREIVLLLRKGSGLSFTSSNGGYLSGNFWQSANVDSSYSFVDVKADGNMGSVNFNSDGTYEIQSFAATLDPDGRMHIPADPNYYSAFDQSGTIGFSLGLDPSDIELDIILRGQ